ncbi:Sodium/hydrogen exchanger [Aphelenchoides besseyi]|nr:Sodium/hydrogen exchanger [Aphelenchoides besseyi]
MQHRLLLVTVVSLLLTCGASSDSDGHQGVKVASFKFDYVKTELILASFIVVIGLFKLLYHYYEYPRKLVPESCCLILLGVLLGLFFFWFSKSGSSSQEAVKFLEFDSKIFFFFLLPPIILESAYSLNDSAFTNNLGTIVIYAVLGTVLNIAVVGGSLIYLDWIGFFGQLGMNSLDCLLFASLIAAVDPVAVLAIFKEVGVNKTLYFMVFGESLLNDAVTVVAYNLVNDFRNLDSVSIYDCFLGFVAFLCVSFGGLAIGLIFGVVCSFVTKFTISARVVEPVICLGMAYLAYVCSELFHFSGIIGMIACGIVQSKFMMSNLSAKSNVSIMYAVKVISSVSECLIFLILGVMLVNERSWFWADWHPQFALVALLLCIGARFIVTIVLTYAINSSTRGSRYISFEEQIIMSYGGLRGAVSFSLAFMISDSMPSKSTILAATYVIILFTVFGQGCTIEFLVRFLKITLAKKEDNFRLFNAFNKGMVDHMSSGIETLLGVRDRNLMKKLSKYTKRYVQPFLERDYVAKDAEHRLLSIEHEESLKENLRRSVHVRRQGTIDAMTKHGSETFDMMDDHHDKLVKERMNNRRNTEPQKVYVDMGSEAEELDEEAREELEAEIEALTNDVTKIQALVSGSHTYVPDRNLIYQRLIEERDERRQNSEFEQNLNRLVGVRDNMSEIKKRRGLLGTKKSKKMSVNKGLLASSFNALSVSNQPSGASSSVSINVQP